MKIMLAVLLVKAVSLMAHDIANVSEPLPQKLEGRYCYHYSDPYSCADAGCFWDERGRYCYHG